MVKLNRELSNSLVARYSAVEDASAHAFQGAMQNQADQSMKSASCVENDIDLAVRQIYKKYGSDLSTFFSDVMRELSLERLHEPSLRPAAPRRTRRD